MSERITIDYIPLQLQFERACTAYQDMKNRVDLVKQEFKEWENQHKNLKQAGTPEEILKHFDSHHEILKRYEEANKRCDLYASMLADFAFENKDLLAAALESEDKKKEPHLRANHTRRGR